MWTIGSIFDPMFLILVGPAFLLAIWAQIKVKSAYAEARRYKPRSGLSGAETAQRILNAYGIADVAIEPANSFLGDHYDPKHRVLRLSPDVYQGRSLAAVGIAAHEVGHAIQHATNYAPLAIRNGLVPMASIGSDLAFGFIMIGIILQWMNVAVIGVGLFAVFVLFQLVNLPVEFNASRRAREILLSNGMVTAEEDQVVGKVLSAAAMTYVAATVTAVLHLIYWVMRLQSQRN